jgi:hypothetical protein
MITSLLRVIKYFLKAWYRSYKVSFVIVLSMQMLTGNTKGNYCVCEAWVDIEESLILFDYVRGTN